MVYGIPIIGSLPSFLGFVLSVLLVIFVIAVGSYVGALWALEVYHGNGDSIFISKEDR